MKFTNVSSYFGLGDIGYNLYHFLDPNKSLLNKEINIIVSQLLKNIEVNNKTYRDIECKDFTIIFGIDDGYFTIAFRDDQLPQYINKKYLTIEKKENFIFEKEINLIGNYNHNIIENELIYENKIIKTVFKIPTNVYEEPTKIKATELLEYKTKLFGGHHYTPIEYTIVDKHTLTDINVNAFGRLFVDNYINATFLFKEQIEKNNKFIEEHGDKLKK